MSSIPVIAIFDVGKTNKKLFLFDENYKIVYEKSARFIETTDEDGFPCENIESLRLSIFDSLSEIFQIKEFIVKAINFSAYGASLVHIDAAGRPLTSLYNYLKPFPEKLSELLYTKYGGREKFSIETASPVLGSLNSGLQLYRLKIEQPEVFKQIKYALHLPQYLSSLLTGKYYSDITSIGCHTALWHFEYNRYHEWVQHEGLSVKMPPFSSGKTLKSIFPGTTYKVGIGLHDSSAALIPYLMNFNEPFILISTGTWCISLNPFNDSMLTPEELRQDCLSFLQYQGKHVKSSRLFSGFEHEQQVKRIADHFNQDVIKYRNANFDPLIIDLLKGILPKNRGWCKFNKTSAFAKRDLSEFKTDQIAYHQLILDLVDLQVASTQLIINGSAVKRIFVDGGFSKNKVYMNLLAQAFPGMEVYAASMAQASAVGAALAIHPQWNSKPVAGDIIQLKYYSPGRNLSL